MDVVTLGQKSMSVILKDSGMIVIRLHKRRTNNLRLMPQIV